VAGILTDTSKKPSVKFCAEQKKLINIIVPKNKNTLTLLFIKILCFSGLKTFLISKFRITNP
jgi:hypothetical protein